MKMSIDVEKKPQTDSTKCRRKYIQQTKKAKKMRKMKADSKVRLRSIELFHFTYNNKNKQINTATFKKLKLNKVM